MKKHFLLSFLMTLVGIFTMQATNVIINVDKAANVIVSTNSGYGKTLDLVDGINVLDLSDADDSPLLIKAAQGAEITSVVKNESETLSPVAGEYTVRFYNVSVKIDIETTGEGGGSDIVKDITMNFRASGEGVTGSPFNVTYLKDGQWVVPEKDAANFSIIPEKASVKITPDAAYSITVASVPNRGDLEGTFEEDGSFVFVNTVPDYYIVNVNMKLRDDAIRFSVTVDWAANVSCYLENQRAGEWRYLTVYDNMKNEFACMASENPLEFIAAGGKIVQILKNGEVQKPIGWDGTGGWIFEVENGDDFVVTTQGPSTDFVIEAAAGNAPLDAYFFKTSDGTVLDVTGMSQIIKGNQGELVYVSARPGTQLSYLVNSNGAITDMMSNFRIVPGADGANPAKIAVYGTRNVNGVVLNVDKASRVKVQQEGGRGDNLSLADGKNEFALADIKNALAISATAGNQMVSVSVNGDEVAVGASGLYMVEAEEGDWVEIMSRKSPIDMSMSFNMNDGADLDWLQATVGVDQIALSSPMTVKSYTTMTLSAKGGYVLENVSSETKGIVISNIAKGVYEVTVASADITSATIDVVMKETEPSEGNAIVVPNGELVTFWEMTYNEDEKAYKFVKKLTNGSVNEVLIGNYVRVYCSDTQSEFKYVRVNGADVAVEPDSEGRIAYVKITGRTTIDALVHTPCQAYCQATYDDAKYIVCGNVYFEVDGQKVQNIRPEAGQTVKFVVEPEVGYVFDHIEKFYSLTLAADGITMPDNTYTFTEEDVKENFILFKGVFKVDENVKLFVLRGSTAWLVDADGNVSQTTTSAMGNVVFELGDGSYARETTGIAGETVKLQIAVNDAEIAEKYEVAGFCLMKGWPTAVIPSNYVINEADADADGVIWINGMMREISGSADSIASDTAPNYDVAAQVVNACAAVRVYNTAGHLVASSEEGVLSVSGLPKGLYVAVSGGKTIKFLK